LNQVVGSEIVSISQQSVGKKKNKGSRIVLKNGEKKENGTWVVLVSSHHERSASPCRKGPSCCSSRKEARRSAGSSNKMEDEEVEGKKQRSKEKGGLGFRLVITYLHRRPRELCKTLKSRWGGNATSSQIFRVRDAEK